MGRPHIVGDVVLSTTKIFTEAKLFPKADIKPFDITEIRMLPFFIEEKTYVIIKKSAKRKFCPGL
jgi:hypothetical protein